MTNQIKVSAPVFGDSINRVDAWRKKHGKNPATVKVNGTETQWADWNKAYTTVTKNKIGNFTFLEFLNSYDREAAWRKHYNGANPCTVRVKDTILMWADWNKLNTIFKNITVTVVIPDSKKKAVETSTREIIAVYHFNQQLVPSGWGEYICGPTSSLIAASGISDVVDFKNFTSKAIGLATAMGTKKSSAGTHPNNMVPGFNKYFTTLNMYTESFTEANIKKNIQAGRPMVINLLTGPDLGYRGSFGHYVTCTGYKDGKVAISDCHGFNIGRGYRYWYPYSTIKKAVDKNGSRPLWVVKKK